MAHSQKHFVNLLVGLRSYYSLLKFNLPPLTQRKERLFRLFRHFILPVFYFDLKLNASNVRRWISLHLSHPAHDLTVEVFAGVGLAATAYTAASLRGKEVG